MSLRTFAFVIVVLAAPSVFAQVLIPRGFDIAYEYGAANCDGYQYRIAATNSTIERVGCVRTGELLVAANLNGTIAKLEKVSDQLKAVADKLDALNATNRSLVTTFNEEVVKKQVAMQKEVTEQLANLSTTMATDSTLIAVIAAQVAAQKPGPAPLPVANKGKPGG